MRYVAVSLNLGRSAGQPEPVFLRQLAGGAVELYQYHYTRDYYTQPARVGAEVSRAPNLTSPVNMAHPPLAAAHFTPAPAGPLAFPPLSAASARNGTGVSLLLRRRGQPGFVDATWWQFPADALAYFAACPALVPDLQAKRYRARTMLQLVRRYNACQPSTSR